MKPSKGEGLGVWAPVQAGMSTLVFLAPQPKTGKHKSIEPGLRLNVVGFSLQCRHSQVSSGWDYTHVKRVMCVGVFRMKVPFSSHNESRRTCTKPVTTQVGCFDQKLGFKEKHFAITVL